MVINCIMCTSKILKDLCLTKQRIKTRSTFAKVFLECYSSEDMLTKHKEVV